MTEWTDEFVAQLAAEYDPAKHVTVAELARRHNVSADGIRREFHRRGIPIKLGGFGKAKSVFTPEFVAKLVEEYDPDNGVSGEVLAQRYGCSASGIGKALKAAGVKMLMGPTPPNRHVPPRVYTDEVIDMLVREYDPDNQMNCAELARRHGLSKDHVSRALKSRGVEVRLGRQGPRPFAQMPEELQREVCRLYTRERLTADQIAERLPIAPGSVYEILERHNIPRRPRGTFMRTVLPHAAFEAVIECIRDGLTIKETAEHLGIGKGAVYHRLEVAGMTPLREWKRRYRRVESSYARADHHSDLRARSTRRVQDGVPS